MAKKENRHAEHFDKLSASLVSASANIEAPYELPEGWTWCRLGDITKKLVDGDHNPPQGVDKKTNYLMLSSRNINNDTIIDLENVRYLNKEVFDIENQRTRLEVGDILFTSVGSLGRSCIFQGNYNLCFQRSVSVINTNQNNHFIKLFFDSPFYQNYVLEHATGTAQMGFYLKEMANSPIPLPPTLAEQQRIVNRIGTMFAKLDEAKDKAQSVVDSFETRKSAILHKAFIGQLTANWRKKNGVSDDSWEEKTLGEICSEIKIGPFGSLLHENDYIENGIPLVNPKHISNQAIKPDTKASISNEKAEELKSYRLLKNDIVLGRRGEMGRCAPVSENENGWLCGTGSMILRLKPEYQARIYSILISSHKSVLYFEENAVGTTLKNLNEKIVKNLPMPIISLPEQQEIVRILDTVLEKESRAKEAAQTVLDQIALLKKSILARAFRGEL
ncbi:MAG: restriction endonuclease subunit S [Treponema sp.]|nr:restriction endonuclease subunit S [Treponema sp.]